MWAWAAGAAMFLLDLPIVGTIRPQLFGQLGAALFLLACAELPTRKHPLVWLPLVAVLWANLHGSILMGLAILGAYAVGVTWNLLSRARLERSRRSRATDGCIVVWAALSLVLAGACINPHGPAALVADVFFRRARGPLARSANGEPLTPGSLTGMLMIASLAVTVLLFKSARGSGKLHEILMLLVFGLATLPAIRMLAWWAVVWPWVCRAARRGGLAGIPGEQNRRADPGDPTSRRRCGPAGDGLRLHDGLVAPPTFSLVTRHGRGEAPIMVTDTPLYVADEVVRRDLAGNIAAPMDWADYLIWKTDGRLKPLVHSHVHLTEDADLAGLRSRSSAATKWLRRLHAAPDAVPGRHPAALSRAGQARCCSKTAPATAGVRIIYQDQRCLLAEVLPPPPKKLMPL